MEEKKQTLFRKKALERISSPDQLTDYLHVTTPGIWVVLAAVILLLGGLLVWASVGTLQTREEVRVMVQDHVARVVPAGEGIIESGMTLQVASGEFVIGSVENDAYGRAEGVAETTLADGTYEGQLVVETFHPIRFLLESR